MALAPPAAADISGGCTGTGDFTSTDGESGNVSIDATGTDRAVIPRSADVHWMGTVPDVPTPRAHAGAVFIDTPFEDFFDFFSIPTEFEAWGDDDAETFFDEGDESYDVETWVPGGAEVVVSGFHADEGVDCDGSITLVLAGSAMDSPTTLIAAGGTVLFLLMMLAGLRRASPGRRAFSPVGTTVVGLLEGLLLGLVLFGDELALVLALVLAVLGLVLALATRRADREVVAGRPTLGAIGGLLAGLFGGVLLWALGMYSLDSVMFALLPLLGLVGGWGLGVWGPLGGASATPEPATLG